MALLRIVDGKTTRNTIHEGVACPCCGANLTIVVQQTDDAPRPPEAIPGSRYLMKYHGVYHEEGEFPAACAHCNDYRNRVSP